MRLEAVTAYVNKANKFFKDYIGFLSTEIETLPGKTDASRILLWITKVAAHNAASSATKLRSLEKDLPPVIEVWTAGDIFSGTPSSPKESQALVAKLNSTVIKTTHHLQRAAEMLALQVKIANSRTYSLPKNASHEQLEAVKSFETACNRILDDNMVLAKDIQPNKSWLNLELVFGSILFRIKQIANGLFKKSVKHHQDDKHDILLKAQRDLRLIVQELGNTAPRLNLTNNTRVLLECPAGTDAPAAGSVHFQYFPLSAEQSVQSFAQYMKSKNVITRDAVLEAIKPTFEATNSQGHRKIKGLRKG